MVQTAAIEKLTFISLIEQFGLKKATEDSFFTEWQTSLSELSDYERERLARVSLTYENFEARDALENTVGWIIISPLLETAGLFLPPFYVENEKSVEITIKDSDLTLKGRLDALVIKDSFWVLTIEAKRAGIALMSGMPQLLAYMLAAPTPQSILYGMVTNGRNFIFVKLDRTPNQRPVYGQSAEFIVDRKGDLEKTLKIIKRLANLIR